MSRCKYIVGTLPDSNIPDAIIFPSIIDHEQMARWTGMTVRGAGFVDIGTDDHRVDITIEVDGESKELGVKAQEEDVKFIRRALALPE